jgi:hypothetical protein
MFMAINTQLSELSDAELIDLYPSILKELKARGESLPLL